MALSATFTDKTMDRNIAAAKRQNESDKELYKRIPKYEREKSKAFAKQSSVAEQQFNAYDKIKRFRETKKSEENIRGMAKSAAEVDLMLEPEQRGFLEVSGKSTGAVSQAELRQHLDQQTKGKMFSFIDNKLGPYYLDFARNGKVMVVASEKGHVAVLDIKKKTLRGEIQLKERVRDVTFLHDDHWFVVAQKKYCYMYSHECIEAHEMIHHVNPTCLAFLPQHFLLVSGNKIGQLVYQDVSTGKVVTRKATRIQEVSSMCQNPYNGVICAGHANGIVSMWSPTAEAALVKLRTNQGNVVSIAVDIHGRRMVTAGLDCTVQVWDLRMFKTLGQLSHGRVAKSVAISQTGVLGVAYARNIEFKKTSIWTPEKSERVYMRHAMDGNTFAQQIKFCPFEDIVGVGHKNGFFNIVVPGVSEANIDWRLPNPVETSQQRSERPVRMLLDKLQPETIVLDPLSVFTAHPSTKTLSMKQRQEKMQIQTAFERRRVGEVMRQDKDDSSDDNAKSDDSGDESEGKEPTDELKKKGKKKRKKNISAPVKRMHKTWNTTMKVKQLRTENLAAYKETSVEVSQKRKAEQTDEGTEQKKKGGDFALQGFFDQKNRKKMKTKI